MNGKVSCVHGTGVCVCASRPFCPYPNGRVEWVRAAFGNCVAKVCFDILLPSMLKTTYLLYSVRENVCNNSKIRKKSCFSGFWKKTLKKRTYSFSGHLITEPFIHNYHYRKSVPVSHKHETSCWEMRTQESMQLRTVCDKCLLPITSGNFEAKISINVQEAHFDGLRTKLLLLTFYDILIRHFKKNVKSHVFWNLKKA